MRPHIKRRLRLLRVPFEWLGILLGLVTFSLLTRRGLLRLCDFISWVMYSFDSRGKGYARENLAVMYGSLPREADLIIRRSYRNMARTVGYAFWTCFRAKRRCASAGEVSPEVAAFMAQNKPAVTVSGHIGCWEILSQLAYLEGHEMMSVAKDIGTSGMTRLLMRARRSIGQEIVHAEGAFRPLMAGIRAGKSLGLLVDQPVDPREGGIWVRFFGHPVPVSAAPAFFAAKAKAAMIIAWSRPMKDGRWRCEKIATAAAGETRDVWVATQACLAALEGVIRRHPSCWVLNYRYFRKEKKFTEEDARQLAAREAKTK